MIEVEILKYNPKYHYIHTNANGEGLPSTHIPPPSSTLVHLHLKGWRYQGHNRTTYHTQTQRFAFCLHFVDSDTQRILLQAVFPVQVDKYTALRTTLPTTTLQSLAITGRVDLFLQPIDSDGFYQMPFYNYEDETVPELISVTVEATRGSITGIYLNFSPKYVAGDTNSTPKILMSWNGTDTLGSTLISHTSEISHFEKYSIDDVILQGTKVFW